MPKTTPTAGGSPLALILLSLLATPRASAQDLGEPIAIRHLTVIDRVSDGGRSPVVRDAVEAELAAGRWHTPQPGDRLALPGRPARRWRKLDAGDDGAFRDRGLGSGYGVARVEVEHERIMILQVVGFRHVYVNGVPHCGDVYGLGITRLPVPLRAGSNELLLKGGRGAMRASLERPRAPLFVEMRDATLPDPVAGQHGPLLAGLLVTNATEQWQGGLSAEATASDGSVRRTELAPLPPCGSRKVVVEFGADVIGGASLAVDVVLRRGADELDRQHFDRAVKQPTDKHQRTFVSAIDDSVQYYAVTPARPTEATHEPLGLILTLHGANVEARNQAYAYEPKTWAHIVAPTNRRKYGFDWEDWGRLDAIEVLRHAEAEFGTDPRRTYLTGHSMGGHGTWNLGAHLAGRFAAIAPSAGWRDFWSYGGAADGNAPDDVQQLLQRAANASRTTLLLDNYRQAGVYVLHGDADDNVPVAQARFMRTQLAKFHPNFAYYERHGAGHWWGNACVDWPPLIAFLHQNTLPEPRQVRELAFTTVDPGLWSRCQWLQIETQQRSLQPSRVEITLKPAARRFDATTSNVLRLTLDLRDLSAAGASGDDSAVLAAGAPLDLRLDGDELTGVTWPTDGLLHLEHAAAGWRTAPALDPVRKGPARDGPFKDAFRNHVVFVVGTTGRPAENAWALAKARFDAETFWYRGNGAPLLVRDVDLPRLPAGNVILYGNRDTNAAWTKLLGRCPVQVERGRVRVGEREIAGQDLACLLTYPMPAGSGLAAAVAATGPAGMQTTDQLPYFVSGVAYPDWFVAGADMLTHGVSGIRAAGFFDSDWQLGDDQAWRGDGH